MKTITYQKISFASNVLIATKFVNLLLRFKTFLAADAYMANNNAPPFHFIRNRLRSTVHPLRVSIFNIAGRKTMPYMIMVLFAIYLHGLQHFYDTFFIDY